MMDSGNEVPAHVLRFLEENIATVPQLETLLMIDRRDRLFSHPYWIT
jgi:hypothetical protein